MGRISFDRSLYVPEAVEAAAAAYAGYAEITLERAGDAVVAVVGAASGGDPATNLGTDLATIEHSFCNLVLQETIVRMRRAPAPADSGGD